jgi:hypothetical protein
MFNHGPNSTAMMTPITQLVIQTAKHGTPTHRRIRLAHVKESRVSAFLLPRVGLDGLRQNEAVILTPAVLPKTTLERRQETLVVEIFTQTRSKGTLEQLPDNAQQTDQSIIGPVRPVTLLKQHPDYGRGPIGRDLPLSEALIEKKYQTIKNRIRIIVTELLREHFQQIRRDKIATRRLPVLHLANSPKKFKRGNVVTYRPAMYRQLQKLSHPNVLASPLVQIERMSVRRHIPP